MANFMIDSFRSAPASPTHGLQFHVPSAPVSNVAHENSPTKTVPQAADGLLLSQVKPTPTSPPTIPPSGLPPPMPAFSQGFVKAAIPLQVTGASTMAGAPLAVSVIKSSLTAVKENNGSEVERNGFSQSSGEESPVETTPQLESKVFLVNKPSVSQVVKQNLMAGGAVPSSGKQSYDFDQNVTSVVIIATASSCILVIKYCTVLSLELFLCCYMYN